MKTYSSRHRVRVWLVRCDHTGCDHFVPIALAAKGVQPSHRTTKPMAAAAAIEHPTIYP